MGSVGAVTGQTVGRETGQTVGRGIGHLHPWAQAFVHTHLGRMEPVAAVGIVGTALPQTDQLLGHES
jgi:hypothetical protein